MLISLCFPLQVAGSGGATEDRDELKMWPWQDGAASAGILCSSVVVNLRSEPEGKALNIVHHG